MQVPWQLRSVRQRSMRTKWRKHIARTSQQQKPRAIRLLRNINICGCVTNYMFHQKCAAGYKYTRDASSGALLPWYVQWIRFSTTHTHICTHDVLRALWGRVYAHMWSTARRALPRPTHPLSRISHINTSVVVDRARLKTTISRPDMFMDCDRCDIDIYASHGPRYGEKVGKKIHTLIYDHILNREK